jgi:hypothetical protein
MRNLTGWGPFEGTILVIASMILIRLFISSDSFQKRHYFDMALLLIYGVCGLVTLYGVLDKLLWWISD